MHIELSTQVKGFNCFCLFLFFSLSERLVFSLFFLLRLDFLTNVLNNENKNKCLHHDNSDDSSKAIQFHPFTDKLVFVSNLYLTWSSISLHTLVNSFIDQEVFYCLQLIVFRCRHLFSWECIWSSDASSCANHVTFAGNE